MRPWGTTKLESIMFKIKPSSLGHVKLSVVDVLRRGCLQNLQENWAFCLEFCSNFKDQTDSGYFQCRLVGRPFLVAATEANSL